MPSPTSVAQRYMASQHISLVSWRRYSGDEKRARWSTFEVFGRLIPLEPTWYLYEPNMFCKDGYRSWITDTDRAHEATHREVELDGTDRSLRNEYVHHLFHAGLVLIRASTTLSF